MPTQIAEGIDERTELRVAQIKPDYREYLQGKHGETALAYIVPQEGISTEAAHAIAQRTDVYEQFTQQIRGIGRRLHIGVIREDITEGWRGFSATSLDKYAALKPGERITFRINGSSDLEKAALSEIKTILEKGPEYTWLDL